MSPRSRHNAAPPSAALTAAEPARQRSYASPTALVLALVFTVIAIWLLTGINQGRLPERVPLALGAASQDTATEQAGESAGGTASQDTASADDTANQTESLSETRPLRE
jgi:hypothetical protein